MVTSILVPLGTKLKFQSTKNMTAVVASTVNAQVGINKASAAPDIAQVEERFTKFSGEPRDAREILRIGPIFGRILSKIVFKMQNKTLAKFQILASDSEVDLHSEIQN